MGADGPDTLTFQFEGHRVNARAGLSVTAALLAQGTVAQSSAKNGAPRGPFCGIGACHECLLVINGQGGQRGCMTTVAADMIVERQPALLDTKALRPLSPVPQEQIRHADIDALVIGSGPAGLAAATGLARRGVGVILLDERHTAGGQYFKQPLTASASARDKQGDNGRAAIAAAERAGVQLRTGTLVWGGFREQGKLVIGVLHAGIASYLRPSILVIATGAQEQPFARPGWTLPGTMTTGCCQTLLRAYGVTPGKRIVVAGNGPLNLQVARELRRAGAHVLALVEAADPPWRRLVAAAAVMRRGPSSGMVGMRHLAALRRHRIPVMWGAHLTHIEGEGRVERAVIAESDGKTHRFEVDTVCLGDRFLAANELARLLGCRHVPDPSAAGGLVVERQRDGVTSEPDVLVVGEAGGFGGAKIAAAQGALAADRAAHWLGLENEDRRSTRNFWRALKRHERFQWALWTLYAPKNAALTIQDEAIACRCEVLTVGTLRSRIVTDDIKDIASLKRLTRAGMGRCQGRYCNTTLAHLIGNYASEQDFPAPQVPLRPVPLAALAVMQPEWRGHVRSVLPPLPRRTETVMGQAENAEVLIIGGGIVGLSTALFLAQAGKKVVVLEARHPNAMASGGNAGSLHAQLLSFDYKSDVGRTSLAALTLPLQRDSITLWSDLARTLGEDLEIQITGGLMVAETEQDLAFLADKIKVERENGIVSELIGTSELRRLEPALSDDLVGASYCPGEGKINPLVATQAIARAARKAGVKIVPMAEVQGLCRSDAGFHVTSTAGCWQAERVVNAAGAFAARVAALLDLTIPVHAAPLQMVVTEAVAPLLTSLVAHASRHLTLKQSASGAFLIGGGWSAGIDLVRCHPRPLRSSLEGNLWVAQHTIPAMRGLHVVRSWAAMNIDIDGGPILGEHPDVPGFFNAVTSNGYTLGPLVGRITADLLIQQQTDRDVSAFSVNRFVKAEL